MISSDTRQRMPAEWESHAGTVILYPHNPCTFRSSPSADGGQLCEPARGEVRNVVDAIADCGEDVLVVLGDEDLAQNDKKRLGGAIIKNCGEDDDDEESRKRLNRKRSSKRGTVSVRSFRTDDSWARDTCPTFVVGNATNAKTELIGLDWDFNAYGGPKEGCYWPCTHDRRVGTSLMSTVVVGGRREDCDFCDERTTTMQEGGQEYKDDEEEVLFPLVDRARLRHKVLDDIVLEGGSIHVDGQGTVLTTEECLLNPNRNPHLTKVQIESILCRELGCSKVLWLPHGLAHDDDTNGHVDNFCCFAKPGHVVLAWTDDMANDGSNYDRCREAERVLRAETDARGRNLTIHKMHLPRPMVYTAEDVRTIKKADGDENGAAVRREGGRLAASYVNFYICNGGIILPQFGDLEMDGRAVKVAEEMFPDRTVKPVYSREILLGGGNIHCITQQVPRV